MKPVKQMNLLAILVISCLAPLSHAQEGTESQQTATNIIDIKTETKLRAADLIIEAAQKLKEREGPYYQVEGVLEASQISQEVPPYNVEHNVTLKIADESIRVKNPEIILKELAKIKSIGGPHYLFSAKFKGASDSSEVPPYITKNSITLLVEFELK